MLYFQLIKSTTMIENNTITHIEIPAPDMVKAIKFYSSVFNWEFEIIKEDSYAFFRIGDTGSGGGLDASLTPSDEKHGHQLCVDVENIDKSLYEIEAAGGTITQRKTEIGGGHGSYALFQDPNGNHLQIHSAG